MLNFNSAKKILSDTRSFGCRRIFDISDVFGRNGADLQLSEVIVLDIRYGVS